jgi:hypothetical protein
MKISIASDLHADFPQPKYNWPTNDPGVLIVAGDTGNSLGTTIKVLRKVASGYHHVVVIDGNHEHYHNVSKNRTVDEAVDSMVEQMPDNVTFLRAGHPPYRCGEYVFIGCNGWYTGDAVGVWAENEALWKSYMNDYRNTFAIAKQIDLPIDLALRDSCHLDKQIGAALVDGLKPVVVTHTCPSRLVPIQKPWDPQWQIANGWYFSSFNDKLLTKYGAEIVLWAHGHVHNRKEMMIDDVRIIANPRGYPGEVAGRWEPLVVEV